MSATCNLRKRQSLRFWNTHQGQIDSQRFLVVAIQLYVIIVYKMTSRSHIQVQTEVPLISIASMCNHVGGRKTLGQLTRSINQTPKEIIIYRLTNSGRPGSPSQVNSKLGQLLWSDPPRTCFISPEDEARECRFWVNRIYIVHTIYVFVFIYRIYYGFSFQNDLEAPNPFLKRFWNEALGYLTSAKGESEMAIVDHNMLFVSTCFDKYF